MVPCLHGRRRKVSGIRMVVEPTNRIDTVGGAVYIGTS